MGKLVFKPFSFFFSFFSIAIKSSFLFFCELVAIFFISDHEQSHDKNKKCLSQKKDII